MPRLLILTPRELTQDVRARRQAAAALARGLDVVGLSGRRADETPAPLPGVPIVRVPLDRVSSGLRRAGLGGLRSSSPPVRELRGAYRLLRLAGTALRLALAGRRLGGFDLVHANELDSLPAALLLARRSGARLVYDAHELYADMESDPPWLYRRAASALEGTLARRADVVVTNCDLFAEELERRLRLQRRPLVVLNCPDAVTDIREPGRGDEPLRAIYQAAVDHPGRPVADLLAAAAHAPGVEVTIRVVHADTVALRDEISRRALDGRVRLSPPVPVDRLIEGLLGFEVGLIINRALTANVELAVPGKLFEYMMAGLAVVVPRLPGLARIVESEGVGVTYEPGRPDDLGRALATLAADRDRLAGMRARARRLALERYNANAQGEALARAWGL